MKNSGVVFIAVFALSCLLIANSCGVTVRVDDPAGAAKSVTDRDKDAEDAEETEKEDAATADARDYSEIVPVYESVEARYDDKIGFEEYYLVENDSTVQTVEGVIRRQFYRAPDGRSPLEIMRYYQRTISDMGGTVIFQTRDPLSVEIEERGLVDYFNKERVDRGMSTYVWDFYRFPRSISEYLTAKISEDDVVVYISIAAGRGSGGAEYSGVRFEVVTVVDEAAGR